MKLLSCIQWFVNGDHPEDHSPTIDVASGFSNYYDYKASPGAVVGRYTDAEVEPEIRLPALCPKCARVGQSHGLLKTNRHGTAVIVCPGDYIAEAGPADYFILTRKDY